MRARNFFGSLVRHTFLWKFFCRSQFYQFGQFDSHFCTRWNRTKKNWRKNWNFYHIEGIVEERHHLYLEQAPYESHVGLVRWFYIPWKRLNLKNNQLAKKLCVDCVIGSRTQWWLSRSLQVAGRMRDWSKMNGERNKWSKKDEILRLKIFESRF